jgi:hypothetical protein
MNSSFDSSVIHPARCDHCGESLDRASECPRCGAVANNSESRNSASRSAVDSLGEKKDSSILDTGILRAADATASSPDFSRWGAPSSSISKIDGRSEEPIETEPAVTPAVVAVEGDDKEISQNCPALSGGVSRGVFLAVLVYASIVTAVCFGLVFLLLSAQQHALESLPDVVPPRDSDGNISRVLAPPEAPLPPGHVLTLGESRRFGDLLVTPVKVTREPLEFVHYRSHERRAPTDNVLKLWLRFENVSERGRRFAPLDAELLFYRRLGNQGLKANNFLSRADDRSQFIAVYDHPPGSDWDLAGQNLGTVLDPGEAVEMFVPSETDLPPWNGPFVWRVHVRKGIAENGWGVTTLIEIAFDEKI